MLTYLNIAICLAGIVICVCRFNKMSASTTKRVIRAQYVIWLGVLAFSGLHSADWVQILLGAGIVSHLVIGMGVWREGTPDYASRRREFKSPLQNYEGFVTRRFGSGK